MFVRCKCGHVGQIPEYVEKAIYAGEGRAQCPKCGAALTVAMAEQAEIPAAEARETEGYRTPWHDMRDLLIRQYGDEIGTWLAKRFGAEIRRNGDPCQDNFRWADKGRCLEMGRFRKAEKAGCCGSHYSEHEHWPSGRTFCFGFNFGH
jgi:hypothetical protein